jgi:hypothetical protein
MLFGPSLYLVFILCVGATIVAGKTNRLTTCFRRRRTVVQILVKEKYC